VLTCAGCKASVCGVHAAATVGLCDGCAQGLVASIEAAVVNGDDWGASSYQDDALCWIANKWRWQAASQAAQAERSRRWAASGLRGVSGRTTLTPRQMARWARQERIEREQRERRRG